MKFKIGDKVRTKDNHRGTIVSCNGQYYEVEVLYPAPCSNFQELLRIMFGCVREEKDLQKIVAPEYFG